MIRRHEPKYLFISCSVAIVVIKVVVILIIVMVVWLYLTLMINDVALLSLNLLFIIQNFV